MESSLDVPAADPIVIWSGAFDPDDVAARNPRLRVTRLHDREGADILVYDGNGRDAVTISLREAPSDALLAALTERNRDWSRRETERGPLQAGPLRIERTAIGELLIRPRSRTADRFIVRFSRAAQLIDARERTQHQELAQILRVAKSWGMLRPDDALWEFDFAYLPEACYYRADGTRKSTREFWATLPIGTVSYIDAGDLPQAEHLSRAHAVVAEGSLFAVVADTRSGGAQIVRAGGSAQVRADARITEMPWFTIPIP